MDNSYSESDVSLSPSQIFEKLDMLRQLQMMQRGKLLKQRLDYQNSPEISSSITEIVSHFSNSTTYNTFKSLLQSPRDRSNDVTPLPEVNEVTCAKSDPRGGQNVQNLIDGVSVLNLSHESENTTKFPISSHALNPSRLRDSSENLDKDDGISPTNKKQISLDEMPILSPKKNFEELIVDTLKHDQQQQKKHHKESVTTITKKQYLKRGEGMARFGIKKDNLIIQNTKSLPWRQKAGSNNMKKITSSEIRHKTNKQAEILAHVPSSLPKPNQEDSIEKVQNQQELSNSKINNVKPSTSNLQINKITNLTVKEPIPKPANHTNKGKNWAAVLTKEQDDFLRKLKQSEYYKTFPSLNKSVESDISSCESSKMIQNKEIAEQNLFDLIEKKVSHDSFNINNSFFDKFIRSKIECSGESTPLIMQKCLTENPSLMHINSNLRKNKLNKVSGSEDESCMSECTDCSECCSVSTCCSCQTEPQSNHPKIMAHNNIMKGNAKLSQIEIHNGKDVSQDQCQNGNDKSDIDKVNANIAEMNAKLIATSDTLKVRLQELEDEIETFRKENANITKMREEIDLERQKFYEDKSAFEQKFNEEKILSEYYLAEEKEKLMKQKQVYERYIRDMRGRLNKKEKDEVTNLKKEISVLKDDIRVKDAKSTSTIARLRNQLKLMEKDKKTLEEEVEKLKKENKRIQHSNDVTRRLTNIKYLEQINRKLSTMAARETKSEIDLDPDIKYKAFEIEKQSKLMTKGIRTRAKSVPNLNVTSKYAKYFSQKDSVSDKGKNALVTTYVYTSDNEVENESIGKDSNGDLQNLSENDDNYLEKIYNERFKSNSPSSKRSSGTNSPPYHNSKGDTSNFFLQKSNSVLSNKKDKSPIHNITPNSSSSNISKSPPISDRLHHTFNQQTVKESKKCLQNKSLSPLSVISNQSTNSQKPITVIYNDSMCNDDRLIPSPEPTSSTSITKTNLNPIETLQRNGTRELRFPNGNLKIMSADGKYSKFIYYNGDIKENFYNKGIIKYFYSESKTYHTTHPDGLEVLEFPDGQVEKRYRDGSSEIRLPNGMVRYYDPNNDAVREEWRYPDGTALSVSANGEQHITFPNGQIEVHTKDHKRREFPDGSVKLVYSDGTSETRYASGRIRIKDKHGNLIMDSSLRKNHTMQ
ncbi:centromere protein J [Pieris rapae]|uniref:centromere protein J n=1 Tax=Pieris rapae TaxID=64459 RepID=UPI001E2806C5|nr:centromere protein J [Pieris rapae]